MKYFRYAVILINLFIVSCFVFPPRVYAYLDPCGGSFIVQFILATLLGVVFAINIYWEQIKTSLANLFSRRRKKTK